MWSHFFFFNYLLYMHIQENIVYLSLKIKSMLHIFDPVFKKFLILFLTHVINQNVLNYRLIQIIIIIKNRICKCNNIYVQDI